jgi:hypothetical protein
MTSQTVKIVWGLSHETITEYAVPDLNTLGPYGT